MSQRVDAKLRAASQRVEAKLPVVVVMLLAAPVRRLGARAQAELARQVELKAAQARHATRLWTDCSIPIT